MNIILASRTLVTVNLLNSSVVYNEIISIARTILNKSCLSSFCTVKNFALCFATKTGTAETFSITLVSNFVKRKAFPKRFCHNDNNNTGNMFRGIDTALTGCLENAYTYTRARTRVHGKRVHGKRVHGKRVHGKRVQCSFVTLITTWRFYWKSSCRPSDCVNDGQIMASVKDNFTVDYVMFSTFIVFQHLSRKSSRISNHLTLLSHAREIIPLLRDEHWRYNNHTFGNLAIQ